MVKVLGALCRNLGAQGIEYQHRAEPKEKKESRIGVHGTAEGMAEPGGEGGPPG